MSEQLINKPMVLFEGYLLDAQMKNTKESTTTTFVLDATENRDHRGRVGKNVVVTLTRNMAGKGDLIAFDVINYRDSKLPKEDSFDFSGRFNEGRDFYLNIVDGRLDEITVAQFEYLDFKDTDALTEVDDNHYIDMTFEWTDDGIFATVHRDNPEAW